jgi:adenylate kinase
LGKVVLLTGAPGVGKSTLRTVALAYRFPALQAFDYGKLLLERKAAEGVKVKMEYRELREKSSSVITPTDVGSIGVLAEREGFEPSVQVLARTTV